MAIISHGKPLQRPLQWLNKEGLPFLGGLYIGDSNGAERGT